MENVDHFRERVEAVERRSGSSRATAALIAGRWSRYLDAAFTGLERGWIDLRVIGPDDLRRECETRFRDHSARVRFFPLSDLREQLDLLRGWHDAGELDVILLGDVSDGQLTRALFRGHSVSSLEDGTSRACILSIPAYPKLLSFIGPLGPERSTFDTLVRQMKHGFHLLHGLGIETPRVALLSAMDKVGIDDLHTYNCRCLVSMVNLEQIPSLHLEGPLSFDTAVDPGTVAHLGWSGPVAGQADAIVVDSRQTRSALALTLTEFGHAKVVRVLLGGRVPTLILHENVAPGDGLDGLAVVLSLTPYLKSAAPLDWLTHPEPIDYAW